jgi:class 3 adenylate cyclase/tetratricopeptide (TPR) repeat protein
MRVCRVCGESNPDRARFCLSCGTPLPDPALAPDRPLPDEIRKTVTVLFCDVVGSTPLGERLEPESVRRVMARFFERMSGVLTRHGGTVSKYIGDAVMAVFGVPVLHEDDALRAVRAADEMRAALERLNEDLAREWDVTLRTRIGINTGQVVVGTSEDDSLVVGDAVNVAARLEQAAAPGEILLGAETYALVRAAVTVDRGSALSLKGKADPVTGYRLLGVTWEPGRTDRPSPTFVGRDRELGRLREALDASVRSRSCLLVTVLGAAGVGKSRLAEEFTATLRDEATVVGGRCLPYGDGITFWPVAEVVKAACGIAPDEPREAARRRIDAVVDGADDAALIADTVAAVCGFAETSAGMQETFWAIRRFLEHVAGGRPLVVVFDDVHWGEPSFLDMVEYLAGRSRDAAILVLCLARPELLETRPTWPTAAPGEELLSLPALSADDSERLIADLLGQASLGAADRARIVEAAGGNPLFVEEMLGMLEDEGAIVRSDGGWRVQGDLARVAVPPTIQALLGARIDRLAPEERAVLGTASVIGKAFWWGAVADLSPPALRPEVARVLQTLVRKGLIVPERSTLAGEDAFRFHHGLIQDATYAALPKERRAELHERFASWIDERAGDRALEHDEIVGYHLEQAFRYRSELGIAGPDVERIGVLAAERLSAAGRRALARGDVAAAVTLLDRAASVGHADRRAHAAILPDLGEALMEAGDLGRADAVLDTAAREAASLGDPGLRGHAAIVRLLLMESTDPKRRSEVALRELDTVIPVFQELGDDLGLARAWRLAADVHWTRARYAAADEAFERAIEHARRAEVGWEEAESLGQYAGSGLYGPAPVDDVVDRCGRIRAAAKGNRLVEARVARVEAALAAMQGRFDDARARATDAAAILEDLGMWLRAAFVSETWGFVEHLAGDAVAAERALLDGFERIGKLGEQGYLSTVSALLAHRILDQGRVEDAERYISASVDAVAEDDVTTQILLQSARGRAVTRRGDATQGERLCRDAVALADETDDLNVRGDVLVDLAEVLRAGGDAAGADDALDRAAVLYDAKGNVVQAAAVRAARRV